MLVNHVCANKKDIIGDLTIPLYMSLWKTLQKLENLWDFTHAVVELRWDHSKNLWRFTRISLVVKPRMLNRLHTETLFSWRKKVFLYKDFSWESLKIFVKLVVTTIEHFGHLFPQMISEISDIASDSISCISSTPSNRRRISSPLDSLKRSSTCSTEKSFTNQILCNLVKSWNTKYNRLKLKLVLSDHSKFLTVTKAKPLKKLGMNNFHWHVWLIISISYTEKVESRFLGKIFC